MKYKVIAWAWLSGFDFLSGIFALRGKRKLFALLYGIYCFAN